MDKYLYIWNDGGSGAHKDVSIWRIDEQEAGFFPLGDVATGTHDKPSSVSMTVKAVTAGALAAPISYTEIWIDAGSGADNDGSVYKLNPPAGYKCLGHVALNGHHGTPTLSNYR